MITVGFTQNPTYYLSPEKNLSQYNFDRWSTDDGLPTNSLLHIHQSKSGYIWISGYSGLIRFNGSEFKTYNNVNTPLLKSNVIRNIAEDSDGRIWFTSQGNGLLSYNRDGEFKSHGEGEVRNIYRGLLVDSKDRVWAASPEIGWFYLEHNEIHVINYNLSLKNIEVRSIVEGSDGSIWFATLGEGIFKYKNGELSSFKEKDGLPNNWVYSMFFDNERNLWIGTSNGLCSFNGNTFVNVMPEINVTVNRIMKDRFGDIWIATINGIYRYKVYTKELEHINSSNGLPNDFVVDFLFDTEGNMWLTHYKGGLARIKDGKFTNYTEHSGFPGNVVNTIAQVDETTMLVGFDSGELFQIKNGIVSSYPLETDLGGVRIRHLLVTDNGDLLVSTYSGLLVVTANGKEQWFNEANGFYGTKIRLSFKDSKGNIWVGTRNYGIIKIDPTYKITRFTVKNGLPSNLIMAIDEDENGNIWIGTSEGIRSLTRISTNGEITNFGDKDGFNSNVVFNITCDNDIIWVTSINGLWAFENSTFHQINVSNGLRDNSVFDIVFDKVGYGWMPFAEGIMKVKRFDLNQCLVNKEYKFESRLYNQYDGLPNAECNPTAQTIIDNKGRLYFATLGGLSIIDPQNVMINNFIPPVVIEEMNVDNVIVSNLSDLVFDPYTKRITFNYAALSFYEPDKVRYEYKLDGFDNDWINTNERMVSYTNLAHGDYTFTVRASNNDGIWNTKGDSIDFTIKTKFTESSLFYIIILISFFVIGYLIYAWRFSILRKNQIVLEHTIKQRTKEITAQNSLLINQKSEIEKQNSILQNQKKEIVDQTKVLEEQKKELKDSLKSKDKIFSIISHDLRSPLGNIRSMLDLLIEKSDQFDTDKKDRIIENLSEITKSTFYLLDNLLSWSRSQRGLIHFDPQMFLVAPIVDDILEMSKPLIEKKSITVISQIDESVLAFGDVNMVETIFRNFIANAIKFTHKDGIIKILTHYEDDFVVFGVQDTGVGMSKETLNNLIQNRDVIAQFGTNKEKGSGLGLLLCRDFIDKNGGAFRVVSEPEKGSTFYFSLKRYQI